LLYSPLLGLGRFFSISWSYTRSLESRDYDRRDPSRWRRGILYPQRLELTLPTSGGRSFGIVCSRTHATEFSLGLVLEPIHSRYDFFEGKISPTQGHFVHTGQYRQNKHTQTSMPLVGFDPTVSVFEPAKTVHTLDRSATVINLHFTLLCTVRHV
jgi:hypothetical protein